MRRAAAALLGAALGAAPALAADAPPQAELGRRLFTGGATPPCALCHTLKEAGTTGAVGPVLDELQPDATRVAKALRGGIGAMPSFAGKLSDGQIEALAQYVAWASRQ